MKYLLSPKIALRGWRLVPRAFYIYGGGGAHDMPGEDFEILKKCDGETDIPESPALKILVMKGFCKPAENGERPTDWQRYRFCDNRHFPGLNWALTGRCNFNCRHCFNAAENERNMSEFKWEQCQSFIGRLDECGVQNVVLTGGEPMIHPCFMDVCREFEKRGMFLEELTTNGSFITEEMLDEFASFRVKPLFKLSFDGLGHHDWFRDKKGAEKDVLEKINMLRRRDFRVRVQTNVHRGNTETILPTARLMNSLGVEQIRVIRTSEAPRWAKMGGDLCLGITEYYDFALNFAREYLSESPMMAVDIWQVAQFWPDNKTYHHRPVEGGAGKCRDSLPVCRGARGQIAVTPEGDLIPCNQMGGLHKKYGVRLGNVHEKPLRKLLNDSEYLKTVCYSVGELRKENPKCQACPHWELCLGGCRALAWAITGSYIRHDPAKCVYFDHYFSQFAALFGESWRCIENIN